MYIIQPPEINKLLQCFLDPSLMLQEHSSAQGDITNYPDPIYALFNPDKADDSECFNSYMYIFYIKFFEFNLLI